MKVLFIHQNFPGQYRAIAPFVQQAGHEVMAISNRREAKIGSIDNVSYDFKHQTPNGVPPWLISVEQCVARGEQVAGIAKNLRDQGWTPDVIVGHCGWGEMMYMRQVFPKARILGFCEYYYLGEGADVGFDPEFPSSPEAGYRCHTRNMHLVQSLLGCDWGISPTQWQASLFPTELQQRIQVVHDGIETHKLTPDDSAWIKLNRDGLVGRRGDEIVTFINRNLEPMRGYHQFMRAVPEILERRPNARVVIVGGDKVSYGAVPEGKQGYKDIFWQEIANRVDASRVHFVSQIPYHIMVNLLRVSDAHVYFTYPFVLSWSMLEAMSLGSLVIGSATPPVQEVIEHGKNGLLVDFFNPQQLANQVVDVLSAPKDFQHLRDAARQTVIDRYDFNTVCMPRHLELIEKGV